MIAEPWIKTAENYNDLFYSSPFLALIDILRANPIFWLKTDLLKPSHSYNRSNNVSCSSDFK